MSKKYREQNNWALMQAGRLHTDNTSHQSSKVIADFRRFWWLHLISFIIGTVPFLTLVIVSCAIV
jgi:hypothetical protein